MGTQYVHAVWPPKHISHATMLSLLSHHCTLDDLLKFNDIGKECAEQ